tara:strand:+ start:167 stop:472 length:306 start_codon:yes stop_codon:yes gene_type:complete
MNTLYEQKDLDIAKGLYKNQEEKCERFARSIHKLRESRKKYDDKREKSKIKFIEVVPEKINHNNRTKTIICSAITMSGKRCTFKASCGKYCKKHTQKLNIL